MDSWMSWFPRRHIYIEKDETHFGIKPTLPITGLRKKITLPEGAKIEWKAREAANAQMLQIYGLKDMVRENPKASWFIISGDD
eukprot:gene45486-51609_t